MRNKYWYIYFPKKVRNKLKKYHFMFSQFPKKMRYFYKLNFTNIYFILINNNNIEAISYNFILLDKQIWNIFWEILINLFINVVCWLIEMYNKKKIIIIYCKLLMLDLMVILPIFSKEMKWVYRTYRNR